MDRDSIKLDIVAHSPEQAEHFDWGSQAEQVLNSWGYPLACLEVYKDWPLN